MTTIVSINSTESELRLISDGKIDPLAFEMDIRTATRDLAEVLMAATRSDSGFIESTHFLIALADVLGGETRRGLERRGLTVEQWKGGLTGCASKGGMPPGQLREKDLHSSAADMLATAGAWCAKLKLRRITEPILLLSALGHVTKAVSELCKLADLDVAAWQEDLKRLIEPITPKTIFGADGSLVMQELAPGARKVLRLLRSEAESLGYAALDPRHLLLALAAYEKGATHYALHQQDRSPRRLHEAVMLSLRGRAKRTRSELPLTKGNMQPILVRILESAAEHAARDRAPLIFEPHLLRGLAGVESHARAILGDERVNLPELEETTRSYGFPEEEEEESTIADIEMVRARLRKRLVGQDDAIRRILPYVQRMRFGFTTPGRPVGVFLFCGQSGSGKTEMAKELARAVYGSEENLVFLEMGQFNSPESMNIFVGAPPGYIGYGEGKLTNGLRDKPRSVVLFDEIEKAHVKVLDALLRFLDEGKIGDPAGPVRDGSECIAILTSNLGAEKLSALWAKLGNDVRWRSIIRAELRKTFVEKEFRPEFLNRVDESILFRTLTRDDYTEIARRLLDRDLERLRKEKQVEVADSIGVPEAIGSYCSILGEGARAAQRLTQSMVITPIISFVLENRCTPPVSLKVRAILSTDSESEPTGVVEYADARAPRQN